MSFLCGSFLFCQRESYGKNWWKPGFSFLKVTLSIFCNMVYKPGVSWTKIYSSFPNSSSYHFDSYGPCSFHSFQLLLWAVFLQSMNLFCLMKMWKLLNSFQWFLHSYGSASRRQRWFWFSNSSFSKFRWSPWRHLTIFVSHLWNLGESPGVHILVFVN